jgi:metacaspase-1
MKIMPHSKPKRSNNIPYSSDVLVDQPSKKKALLIGINNTLMIGDGPRETQLKAPHKDVQAMRSLLVETYQYDSKNVVSLIDIDDPKQPQPTKDNIVSGSVDPISTRNSLTSSF